MRRPYTAVGRIFVLIAARCLLPAACYGFLFGSYVGLTVPILRATSISVG
jgi:hypothetical protein